MDEEATTEDERPSLLTQVHEEYGFPDYRKPWLR